MARLIQQIYRGVGTVITVDEARSIVNQLGGVNLPAAPPSLQPQAASSPEEA